MYVSRGTCVLRLFLYYDGLSAQTVKCLYMNFFHFLLL